MTLRCALYARHSSDQQRRRRLRTSSAIMGLIERTLLKPGEIDATLHGGLGTFLEWAATGVGNSTGKGGAIT